MHNVLPQSHGFLLAQIRIDFKVWKVELQPAVVTIDGGCREREDGNQDEMRKAG